MEDVRKRAVLCLEEERVLRSRENPKIRAITGMSLLGWRPSLLGARTLLGAPGLTTRSKKLLGAPGIAARSKDTTRGSWHRY